MNKDEEIYRKLFEGSNDAIFILNDQGIFIDCNLRACEMLDRQKEEILGKTPVHISPEFQPNGTPSIGLVQELNNGALGGEELRFEWVFTKNGINFPVEVAISSFTEDQKTFIHGVVKDLTELKTREKELQESEERFRQLFDQSADSIFLYHPEEGFVDCNSAGLQLVRKETKDQILGYHPWDFTPNDQPDGYSSKFKAVAMHKKCLSEGQNRFEWLIKFDEKNFWFDVVMTRIVFQNKVLIHVIMRDITQSKDNEETLLKYQNHLEDLVKDRTFELQQNQEELIKQHEQLEATLKELKEAQDQLIKSEKMASLGVLSAGVGHEINNPLNYIKGGVDGFLAYFEDNYNTDDQNAKKFFSIIKEGVDRASLIVNSLSHYSRRTSKMNERCEVSNVLNNCLTILHNKLKRRIEVERDFADEELIVLGNEGRLHQAFMNIIANAEQAISDEGTIKITTRGTPTKTKTFINDSGEGISDTNLPRIMDPFFTTKEPGEGTGLGLAITYKIIEEHKGEIEVTSKKGEGTTFIITLPRMQ